MFRRIFYCSALSALVCLMLCACEKKNVTAYVFEPGKVMHYRLWVNQQIESESADGSVRISMRTDFDLKPLSVSADGLNELEMTFTGASASATNEAGRKEIDMKDSLVNKKLTLKMKPNGEIPELILPELDNRNHYSNLTKLRHVIMDMFATLPGRLNNGTAWTRKTVVEEDFRPLGRVSTETLTSFVAGGEVEVWNERATEIAVNFDIRLGSEIEKEHKKETSPEDGMPQSIHVSGGGSGDGKMYFDPKRNICIGAAYETTIKMTSELLFEDATKNTSSSQNIKTGIVLKLLTEKNAR